MPLDVWQDLDDFIPDAPLDRGPYAIEIRDCKETTNGSLHVMGDVFGGTPQKNGKSVEGRDYNFFLDLHPENAQEEKQRMRRTNLLKKFFLAAGLTSKAEAADFIGKKIWVQENPWVKNTGEVQVSPQDFRPYVEG